MTSSVITSLETSLATAKTSVKDAAEALDEAILHDPALTHKQRMVLIHLQAAARRHNLLLEQLALCVELVDQRCDIIMNHLKNT